MPVSIRRITSACQRERASIESDSTGIDESEQQEVSDLHGSIHARIGLWKSPLSRGDGHERRSVTREGMSVVVRDGCLCQ